MKHKEGVKVIAYIVVFIFLLAFGMSIYSYTQEPEAEVPVSEEAVTENITLDFKDADIKSVLNVIARKAAINIVATPEVKGLVTIRLENIHWEQALDTIVKTYGFGYEWVNPSVIMVSTLERLAEQRRIQEEAAAREPIDTQTFILNFSRAADVQSAIERLITARGRSSLEPRSNTLIITDTKSNLIRLGQIIRELDKITPQVMIEARIIETTLGSDERLGIDWGLKVAASGSKRPNTFPFQKWGPDRTMYPVPKHSYDYDIDSGEWTITSDFAIDDFPSLFPKDRFSSFPMVGADQFLFGTLDFSEFQAVLEILDQRTDTNIISNPRITTLNNQEAKILVGTIIPIPIYDFSRDTGTRVISGYQDQEVGIQLLVTPNINQEGYITLDVTPKIESIVEWTGPFNERPIISTRSAETKVMVKDGGTLVIGGLITEDTVKLKKKVPLLGDIPIMGLFFSKKTDIKQKRDLMIFITPRIIQEDAISPEAGL